MDQLQFTMAELIPLLGVVQCVFILVFFLFRSGKMARAGLPFLYFLVLAFAFASDFAHRFISDISEYYELYQLTLWFAGPPLSVLMIFQIAQITKTPSLGHFWVLFFPFYAVAAAYVLNNFTIGCDDPQGCREFTELYVMSAQVIGTVALLTIWLNWGMLENLHAQKFGKERYWLILSVVIINAVFLLSMFSYFNEDTSAQDLKLIRNILGLMLIYLVMTSLFRIYPQAVRYVTAQENDELTDKELNVALQIERLIAFEKVYQEPGYGRSELAREIQVPESTLSRIINLHFQKSLPQLLNEKRVEDAKSLLIDTNVNVSIIAEEVGFNSLASFNRVFKDIAGIAPSAFRQNKKLA